MSEIGTAVVTIFTLQSLVLGGFFYVVVRFIALIFSVLWYKVVDRAVFGGEYRDRFI